MKNDPKVSIIILNWNGKPDTLACLESLKLNEHENTETIVVDNGSTDGSIDAVRSLFPNIKLIENGKNLGYAEGNNVGIRHALSTGTDYVFLLNNDAKIEKDTITKLLESASKNLGHGVFGATIYYENKPNTISFFGARWNKEKIHFDYFHQDETYVPIADIESDYACGAALFFRASVAQSVGLLDPKFFLVWEESDWCFRARREGFKCLIVSSAKIWHTVGSSFSGETSPLRQYYSQRNRLLWVEKNLSKLELLRTISHSIDSFFPQIFLDNSIQKSIIKKLILVNPRHLSKL